MLHTHEATGSSPVVSTKKIPWNRKVLRDFFLTFEGCFPLFFSYGGFPLPSGNAPDKVLHPLCAFPLHLLSHMTLDDLPLLVWCSCQTALYSIAKGVFLSTSSPLGFSSTTRLAIGFLFTKKVPPSGGTFYVSKNYAFSQGKSRVIQRKS